MMLELRILNAAKCAALFTVSTSKTRPSWLGKETSYITGAMQGLGWREEDRDGAGTIGVWEILGGGNLEVYCALFDLRSWVV